MYKSTVYISEFKNLLEVFVDILSASDAPEFVKQTSDALCESDAPEFAKQTSDALCESDGLYNYTVSYINTAYISL